MTSMLLTLMTATRERFRCSAPVIGLSWSGKKTDHRPKLGDHSLIFARSQVWGTLKRYLMYTTAGFIVLGGLGAAWSHRPAAVEKAAAADQFAGVRAADQLAQPQARQTQLWAQRLMADLTAQSQSAPKKQQTAQL